MNVIEAYEKRGRTVKLARTYLRKAIDWMIVDALPSDPAYWSLLEDALNAAYEILERMPDEFFESVPLTDWLNLGVSGTYTMADTSQETVEKIVSLLAERGERAKLVRRIELLEQVEGRTPEEAAAHLSKAAALRERMGDG